MAIYLMQHAAAKTEAEDPQRSLTDEGKRIIDRVGEHLTQCGVTVDHIEHSVKARAQTAEILAARLQPAQGTTLVPGLAPIDNVEPTCLRLNQETATVMLVGHLAH